MNETKSPSKSKISFVSHIWPESWSIPKLNNSNSKNIGNYVLLDKIGRGAFSSVYRSIHKDTGKEYAIKLMKIQKNVSSNTNKWSGFHEISCLQSVTPHPNITNFIEILETEKFFGLVIEYIPFPTLDNVILEGPLPEACLKEFFRTLCETVFYLHGCMIIHRDLKAENILMKCNKRRDDYSPVICDFGFSTSWSKEKKINGSCGSTHYASPEILLDQAYFGPEVDIWSIGVILYLCISGFLPFNGNSIDETKTRIIEVKYGFSQEFPKIFKHLIKNIFQKDTKKRFSENQILSHPCLRNSTVFNKTFHSLSLGEQTSVPSEMKGRNISKKLKKTVSCDGNVSKNVISSTTYP